MRNLTNGLARGSNASGQPSCLRREADFAEELCAPMSNRGRSARTVFTTAAQLARMRALGDEAARFGRRLSRRYAAERHDRNLRKPVLAAIRCGWPDLRGRPRDPLVTEAEHLRAQGWLWPGIAERLRAGVPEGERRRRLRRLRAAVGARRASAGGNQQG